MSEWDEVAAEHENKPPVIDDGFGKDPLQQHDEGDVVDVAFAKKKKGPNPKMIAGVLALVTLTFVAYMGFTVYRRLSKPKPVIDTPIVQAAPEVPAGGKTPTTIMDSSPAAETTSAASTSVQSATPSTAAAPEVKSVPAPVAASTAAAIASVDAPTAARKAAVVTTPAAMEAPPAVTQAADPKLQLQVSNLESRMTSLEGSINKLTETVAHAQLQPKAQAKPKAENLESAKPVVSKAASPKTAKTQVSAKSSKKILAKTEKPEAVVAEPVVLALQLRGVYPPNGEDRQAWILNPKTNAITVVSKGSTIEGGVVTHVELDNVLTTRGIIR